MSLIQIDRLTRQNSHKTTLISRLQNQIQCLKNDLSTFKQLTKRLQIQKNKLLKQIQQVKRKREQDQYQKQNTQNRYLSVLKKLQQQVQQGKKKFNKLNNKIQPLIDYDTVRLTILNQVNSIHDLQLEKYKNQIENHKDQIVKLKRQKSLLQHKVQTLKLQYAQQMRQVKHSIKSQNSQNQLTLLTLEMSKQVENRLKVSYETVRKEAQYYKEKYFTTERKYQQKVNNLEKQIKKLIKQNNKKE